MRRPLFLIALLALIAAAMWLPNSGASFTSSSAADVRVATDSVGRWLHLYSQSTDPAGLTDYWLRAPSTSPAAVGADATLSVDLGRYTAGGEVQCPRVFTIEGAPSFPTGTSITVTATLVPDSVTGVQPISALGFRRVGQAQGSFPNPVTLGTGEKRQANLRLNLALAAGVYHPRVLVTVTYTGMTATYYRYSIPFRVEVVSGGAAALSADETPLESSLVPSDETTPATDTTPEPADTLDGPPVELPGTHGETLDTQDSAQQSQLTTPE